MANAMQDSNFVPIACAELELSAPELPLRDGGTGLAVLILLHGDPLGQLTIARPIDDEPAFAAAVEAVREPLRDHLAAHGESVTAGMSASDLLDAVRARVDATATCPRRLAPMRTPKATASISTLGIQPRLPAAVRALLAQDYEGPFDVVVVDNAPHTGRTAEALAGIGDPRLRIVPQPKAGVSQARNAALAATDAEILAYTDDDVIADPGWLRSAVAAFCEDDRVAIVTGLVIPGSLRTQAEQWFEAGCGFTKGYQRAIWAVGVHAGLTHLGEPGDGGPLFPYSAGYFGSGNSLAVRCGVLRELGGWDIALGPGTPAVAGEDLEIVVRTLLAGHVVLYEPRAYVRHFHRDDVAGLESQMANYGVGLTAYLSALAASDPRVGWEILKRVPRGLRLMSSPSRTNNSWMPAEAGAYPTRLRRMEWRGYALGPIKYAQARRKTRQVTR